MSGLHLQQSFTHTRHQRKRAECTRVLLTWRANHEWSEQRAMWASHAREVQEVVERGDRAATVANQSLKRAMMLATRARHQALCQVRETVDLLTMF